jgi:protein KRI1
MRQQFGEEYYGAYEEDEFAPLDDTDDFDKQYLDDYGDDDEEDDYEGNEYEAEIESSEYANDDESAHMPESALDNLYQLDYEDIIDGMPCRFKYRQVQPESFGLDIDDLLLANDTELNHYVSLKKLAPYRDSRKSIEDGEKPGKLSKKRRKLRAAIKERMEKEATEAAASGKQLKGTAPSAATKVSHVEQTETKRKRKRRKGDDGLVNNSKLQVDYSGLEVSSEAPADDKVTIPPPKKRKHRSNNTANTKSSQKSRMSLLK